MVVHMLIVITACVYPCASAYDRQVFVPVHVRTCVQMHWHASMD